MSNIKGALVAGLVALTLPIAAQAAPIGNVDYTSTGNCDVTDLTVTADACIGVISGNDDNGFKDDTNANKANFNLDAFDGVLGMFGKTNWSFLAKANTSNSNAGSTHTEDGVTINFGATSTDANTWSTVNDLSAFEFVAIVLKQSKGFSAYLYDGNAPSSGEWKTTVAAFGNNAGGLSHLSIYTGPTSTTTVPLPAGGLLLIGALAALGLRRRS